MVARLLRGVRPGSLDLLAAGAIDMPASHQTLRAAIAWSYDLLSPAHRALFLRLAVFVGEPEAESLALLEREYDNLQVALIYPAQADERDRDDNGVPMRTEPLSSR